MKDYKERIKKYEQKLKLDIFKDYPKEEMVRKYQKFVEDILPINKIVKEITDKYGINVNRFFYYSFANEVYKIMKKYKSESLKKELKIRHKKWVARGLKKKVLLEIENAILGSARLPEVPPEASPGSS